MSDYTNFQQDSGNSYTWITNNITVADSFNTSNSRNGHGRGGMCGILSIVLGLGIPILVVWFILSLLTGWLT